MDEVMEMLKSIKKEIKVLKAEVTVIKEGMINQQAEIREIVSHKNMMVEELINNIETKLDIYGNIEFNPSKPPTKKTAAKITTLAFLKKELDDDLYKYGGDLYEDDDIDELKVHPDVKKKKSEAEIKNKLISLLHTDIKKIPSKIKKLEEYRDLYIQNLKNDEIIE
jgi:hypothetical protein